MRISKSGIFFTCRPGDLPVITATTRYLVSQSRHLLTYLLAGQRCSGRNYNGRRCCTPEQPCGLGEGDCDGPLDGGTHDGHQGCEGDLVCGSNNCKKFGSYFHEKDDCCDRPGSLPDRQEPEFVLGAPLEPPEGMRSDGV